ncbi:MAG: anthranilate phosphoribosyltransferase [Paludibaculum sp.]
MTAPVVPSATLKPIIAKVATGAVLTREEARAAFDVIMSGEATPAQLGAFLMALRVRGETVDEITGAVDVMRARMIGVAAPADAIDIVGTGGDGIGSYNVSTCAAFVIAAAGVPVAKHGNRALSSLTGSAEVLTALGVNINVPPEKISECVAVSGVGFMFAPTHHTAMRHVGPIRVELGVRTIFNLVGPLANPAGVTRQMTGVFARQWVEPVAQVLRGLGSTKAWIVHGEDGLDEITTTGETYVAELKDGEVTTFTVSPEQVGLRRAAVSELKGGKAAENAEALRRVLLGDRNAFRDIVLMNAGAGLVVAGKAETLKDGVATAASILDFGAAMDRLKSLVAVSNG